MLPLSSAAAEQCCHSAVLLLRCMMRAEMPCPHLPPALLLQSKVEESRAFQNSSILAPRYLSASPYKGPKRKSKGSLDQY